MTFAYRSELPINDPVDIAVCGGGPTGVAAALAAARGGLRVLLIEQSGQCGGTGTSSGVSHLLGGRTNDNRAWCVAGIFKELVDDLAARGDAVHPESIRMEPGKAFSPYGWTCSVSPITYGVPIDPHGMAALIDEKMLAAGVSVLFNTAVVDVRRDGSRITGLVIYNKSGLRFQPVTAVVDATGDADIAFRSGCETVSGRPSDGLMTPATLIFHAEGVDEAAHGEYIEKTRENRFLEMIKDLRAKGIWDFPYERLITVRMGQPGVFMIN